MAAAAENSSTPDVPGAWELIVGMGRAFAGALVFSLPMMMTMEMWDLGVNMPPQRLALLLLLTVPVLIGLSRYGGFRSTARLPDDVADAIVGMAVAFAAALAVLWIFGQINSDTSFREMLGKVALQMVPGSIGALLAQNQLGGTHGREKWRIKNPSYFGELFLMAVGALFLSLNIAPTDEVTLIAYAMTPAQVLLLMAVSLAAMHAFVYVVEFRGTLPHREEEGAISLFFRFSLAGYALVLLVCLLLLWFFSRIDGTGLVDVLNMAIVLGFPATIGAAVARLAL